MDVIMVRTPIVTRRIYQMLFVSCPAYRLARPWNAIEADANVRACPEDARAMVDQLANHFHPDDLIKARVCERAGLGTPNEGGLVPTPPLSAPGAPLIFLREARNQMPFEVLTAAGGLSGWHLPLISAVEDHVTIKAMEMRETIETRTGLGAGDPYILVACTIVDVVLLRVLCMPATLASGMDCIDRNDLPRICQRYGWRESPIGPAGF